MERKGPAHRPWYEEYKPVKKAAPRAAQSSFDAGDTDYDESDDLDDPRVAYLERKKPFVLALVNSGLQIRPMRDIAMWPSDSRGVVVRVSNPQHGQKLTLSVRPEKFVRQTPVSVEFDFHFHGEPDINFRTMVRSLNENRELKEGMYRLNKKVARLE